MSRKLPPEVRAANLKAGKISYYEKNRDRIRAKAAKRREEHPDKIKSEGLWTRFKITLSDYERMFREQFECCAICKRPEQVARDGKVKSLAVDHCHKSGTVRGLLCHRCNVALGQFDDDIESLTRAIQYLKRST